MSRHTRNRWCNFVCVINSAVSALHCMLLRAQYCTAALLMHCCFSLATLLLCTAALLDCVAMLYCAALLYCCTAVAVPLYCARHHDTKITMWLGRACQASFNSLTPKCVLMGMKNSLLEDFLLAKHKDTNIPTMMEPFPPPAAWFWWTSVHHPREPTRKGLDEAVVEGF